MDLNDMGTEFISTPLNRWDLLDDPFEQFKHWMARAIKVQEAQPNAMTLSTVDAQAQPSCRIVYLKSVDHRGFVFFTNYQSQKAKDLDHNPKAALTFYWPELEQQIRITGEVGRTTKEESDGYFNSRSRTSQLGAWASEQSQILTSREALDEQYKAMEKRFPGDVPRPPHWGGYRLVPNGLEFWQGRINRCHDRFVYQLTDKGWTVKRLYP